MDLVEILNRTCELTMWKVGAAGAATAIAAFTIGYIWKRPAECPLAPEDEDEEDFKINAYERPILEEGEIDDPDDYKKGTIMDAWHRGWGRVEASILSWYNTPDGYSGIMKDDSVEGRPFHIDLDELDEGEGLVPLLLQNSKETGNPINMAVNLDRENRLYFVRDMELTIGHTKYDVC